MREREGGWLRYVYIYTTCIYLHTIEIEMRDDRGAACINTVRERERGRSESEGL